MPEVHDIFAAQLSLIPFVVLLHIYLRQHPVDGKESITHVDALRRRSPSFGPGTPGCHCLSIADIVRVSRVSLTW